MKVYRRSKKIFWIALIASCFWLHPISAAAIEFGRPTLSGSVEHISSSDVDEANPQAEVSVTSTIVGMALPTNLTENSDLEVKFSGGLYYFDWSDTERLKFSKGKEPWDDLYSAEFGLAYVYKWNKKWASFLGSGIGAGWEKDTDDIYSYRGFLGTSYRWGQKLNWKGSLGFGFGLGPEEKSSGFFSGPYGTTLGPFGGISWNEEQRESFQPGWSFKLEFVQNLEIAYVFNEHWAVNFFWGDFGAIFRLADDNDISPEGLLAVSYSKSELAVDFRPIETLTLTLGFSEYFHKELDIQDDDGNSLQKIEVHDSFGVRFSVNWAF
jgi:hypothetical protein